MSNNNYSQDFYEEISLQDLFMALWKQKVLIIIFTLAAAMISGIFSIFILKPVYHARLDIIINMPETYQTKYGDFLLPISTNEQYINLITSSEILKNTIEDMGYDTNEISIESLRDRISIVQTNNNNAGQNSFVIRVAANNPQEAKLLAEVLYNNYIEFVDVLTAKGAVEYFIDYYSVQVSSLNVELKSNKALLEKYTELLASTPMTINQKEAIDSIKSADKISNIVIMENIINPNYTALEQDIIDIKQTINTIESNIDLYNTYLDELKAKKAEIEAYYNTGEFNEISNKIVRVTTSNIYLVSEPVAPSRKSSPNNFRNILIGAVLGAMVSVLAALIREFWFKKDMQ
ncbi:subunit length determinant protein [Herbinix hemicellulosilytica]|uniref:Polysaccharide chain length determinant N-terminal domain-containing protein n=1 Tax=Herbinix hemicellulosilytica TaxID=1564487 RepID=A0A0H5SG44_HERHM|nr:Wzz/FepE/Etk N-terminal domain-containing protein [Herbinix hemicellulosilytica]RBP60775.1 subunit length determinant protein [Herbinix hemicellulosilytica]CRZ34462.1 hypothetical protein HHT355_1260 [Herbinix hemicellulosilytica]